MSDAGLSILFESQHIVVVDKPVGIATEPDKDGAESLRDRLGALLISRGGGKRRPPHAVSRLDTNVSGAVTFAISDLGAQKAAAAQQHGHIVRRYVAICAPLAETEGRWTSPVQGKPAASRFKRVAAAGGRAALLVLEPETGRTHQLRIHASGAGAPIFGDGRYGGKTSLADSAGRVQRVDRVLLHSMAVRVSFGLPADPPGFVVAPIPAALLDVWQVLDGAAEAWNDVASLYSGTF